MKLLFTLLPLLTLLGCSSAWYYNTQLYGTATDSNPVGDYMVTCKDPRRCQDIAETNCSLGWPDHWLYTKHWYGNGELFQLQYTCVPNTKKAP